MSARERNHYACCLLPCTLPFRGKTALPIFPKIFLVFRLLFRVRLVLRSLSGGGRLPLGILQPGVLFGPYCPVYGVGALLFLLLFYRLIQGKPWKRRLLWLPLLFVGCMVSATLVELGASYLCEALTGSWPWQTYVNYRYHFQGRIALSPSIRFGLGGLFFLYVLQPLLDRGLAALSPRARGRLAALLAVLMGIDLVFFLVGTFS